jgi:hypothetical protein
LTDYRQGNGMLNSNEKMVIIYALEEYAKVLEAQGNIRVRNEVFELTWKISSSLGVAV